MVEKEDKYYIVEYDEYGQSYLIASYPTLDEAINRMKKIKKADKTMGVRSHYSILLNGITPVAYI